MRAPAPLSTARWSHLISALRSCPAAAPIPQEAPTVRHGFTLFQYDLARAESKCYDMERGTFLLQAPQLRSLPSYNLPKALRNPGAELMTEGFQQPMSPLCFSHLARP